MWAALQQLRPQQGIGVRRAWEIYVQIRLPHHLVPAAWSGHRWLAELALATGLFLLMYLVGRSRASRFLAAYALASVSLFVVGLAIYAWGDWDLLRFYWFRFGDVMIPFMGLTSVGLVLCDLADGRVPIRFLPDHLWKRVQGLLRRVLPALLLALAAVVTIQAAVRLASKCHHGAMNEEQAPPMLAWIAANTPRDAVFLVDPTMSRFYVHAQRAMFVSFKHMPQSAADILEWYRRITLCNSGRPPMNRGFRMERELRASFYDLDEQSIRRIADEYGITYYLGSPAKPLGFERVHSTSDYVLYLIDGDT